MGLAEFLLARIAEDEESAKSVNGNRTGPPAQWTAAEVAAAYARHLLAECEAKRRIVKMHSVYELPPAEWRPSFGCRTCADDTYYANGWCDTIKALALPYADHPDYLPEWRPDPANAE